MIAFELRQVRSAPDAKRPYSTVFLEHVVEIVPEEWGAKVFLANGLATEVTEEYAWLLHRIKTAVR